jgi:acetyl-CoA C-acetyltransferase
MPEAFVISAARSPIGRAGNGSLSGVPPDTLATMMIRAAMDKIPQLDACNVGALCLGCSAEDHEPGENIAHRAAIRLGLEKVRATTVNRLCASSVHTARMAFHAIKAGEGGVFISAGVDCASRCRPQPPADCSLSPAMLGDLAPAQAHSGSGPSGRRPRGHARPDIHTSMGHRAELLASSLGISRYEQDEFGVRSHLLTEQAIGDGFFTNEITPVTLPDGSVIAADDFPRHGVSYGSVNQLTPSFWPQGRITPGNSAPLGDGAAAVIIMDDVKARELSVIPLARIVATGVTQLSPQETGLGAVEAASRALASAGMVIGDMDLIEINEAFAVQVIACHRALRADVGRLNVHGGAIALGHPFGMTGARIMTTLLNGLRSQDAHMGLLTLCAGGGQGAAIILERLS